jgi:hypothetical protein
MGKPARQLRSEIPSLEAHGVNLAVWVQERAGPINLSWVSAPDVRNCQIKTTPCVEKKDLLGTRPQGSLSGSECSGLAEMGSGLYRRGQPMGEGESLWSPIICDHQMEQVDIPG